MTNDTRSPQDIEREIERERAGLTNTLDDLQHRFSVESIARQFSDQFREHGGDIGRSVSDAVKRNPVALALTGAGLAWLMMGNGSGGGRRYDRDDYDGGERRIGDDRYSGEARSRDRSGRESRADYRGDNSNPRGKMLGPQPGDTSKPQQSYYKARRVDPEDFPSWARSGYASDGKNTNGTLRDTASGVKDSVTDAASTAADKARQTGSSISETASNAAGSISDTAKGAAGHVSDAGKSVADGARNLAASASDNAAAFRERLADGTETLSEEARKRVVAARERAIEAQQAAANYARQGRDRAVDIFDEQPLIAGALAVALGAAVAAALPRSRMEDEYLGDQSDHLIDEAERIFADEKQKLTNVAKAATDEAKKVVDEAKEEVGGIAKAATDRAKASGERIADAAGSEAKKQNVGDLNKS